MPFDLPLDPVAAELFLSKKALSQTVAIGDFLQYEITVQNAGAANAGDVTLVDTLPVGFRYQQGSLRVDGAPVEDARVDADGRTVRIDLGGLILEQSLAVRYVVEVTAGARLGEAINRVTAIGPRVVGANSAEASVIVREDLLRSEAILVGRVYDGACEAATGVATAMEIDSEAPAVEAPGVQGLAGVRIFMEDGTSVITDSQGRWHIEGVEPGTHVLQIDLDSLPNSHRVIACENEHALRGHTVQSVRGRAGRFACGALTSMLQSSRRSRRRSRRGCAPRDGDRVHFQLNAAGRAVPLTGVRW